MKILIINGPNINMIGIREKNVYGSLSYLEINKIIEDYAKEKHIQIEIKQSNHEGEIVDFIQEAYFSNVDGLIINPAAYTHTSIAILDALKSIYPIPVIEVHFSDISKREDFRKMSYTSMACFKQIKGKGYKGYLIAIDELIKKSGIIE